MNKQALFCDGTAGYVIPSEPKCNQSITLRFRTAKDDDLKVRLVTATGTYDLKKERVATICPLEDVTYTASDNKSTFVYCQAQATPEGIESVLMIKLKE